MLVHCFLPMPDVDKFFWDKINVLTILTELHEHVMPTELHTDIMPHMKQLACRWLI